MQKQPSMSSPLFFVGIIAFFGLMLSMSSTPLIPLAIVATFLGVMVFLVVVTRG